MTTQEIVDALTNFSKNFPRAALSEAPGHMEELVPRLLDALDYVSENGARLMAEDSPYHLHFFAMYLLAQFREIKAFPKLVRLLRIDKDTLDYLLGDAITEGVNRCLYCVYDGNLELLKELIEDMNADEFARGAALEAFEDFDRKYMVHYESAEWVDRLSELLIEYKDKISREKFKIFQDVNAVLRRNNVG